MDKFSTWTKFSHVEIECMRLEICPLFHTAHSNLPTIHPVSQTLSVSQSSNTLTQTPKSGKHSQSLSPSNTHSNTKITHPHPSNALLFPHNRLQTIPSPIPSKSLLSLPMEVQIFSILKVCFLICMFIYREMRNNL